MRPAFATKIALVLLVACASVVVPRPPGAGAAEADAGPGPAGAAARAPARPLVAVARADEGDGAAQEIATRIIAELMANGISVMALACAASDPGCVPEAREGLVATVLVTQVTGGAPVVEIRSQAGYAGETTSPPPAGDDAAGGPVSAGGAGAAAAVAATSRVHRIALDEAGGGAGGGAGARPAVLAVRTVEFLRAIILDPALVVEDPLVTTSTVPRMDREEPRPIETIDRAARPVPRAARPPRTLSIGAATIGHLGGLGLAVGPALRVSARASRYAALSATVVGPAFGWDIQAPEGSVSIRQELGLLQVELMGNLGSRFVAWAGLGAGLYHIHVDGRSSFGLPAASEGAFSVASALSAGATAAVTAKLGLFAEARLLVLTPTQIVQVNGVEVGRAGSPGVMVTGGVEFGL